MTVKPQIIERTIPRSYNYATREWMPERTRQDRTGWFEAVTDDGLHALATTEAAVASMIERMRKARCSPTETSEP